MKPLLYTALLITGCSQGVEKPINVNIDSLNRANVELYRATIAAEKQKYRYTMLACSDAVLGTKENLETLNKYGDFGWELCGVSYNGVTVFYFKQPIINK